MGSQPQFPLSLQRSERSDSIGTGTTAFASPTTAEAHPLTPTDEGHGNSQRSPSHTRHDDDSTDNVFAFSQANTVPREQQYPTDLNRESPAAAHAHGYTRPEPSSVPSTAESWANVRPLQARIPSAVPEETPAGTVTFAAPEGARASGEKAAFAHPLMLPEASDSTLEDSNDVSDKREAMNVDPELGIPVEVPPSLASAHSVIAEGPMTPNINRSAFQSWRYDLPPDDSGLRRRFPPTPRLTPKFNITPRSRTSAKMEDPLPVPDAKQDDYDVVSEAPRPVLLSAPPKTGYTERTEQTVPHGITTWGDGVGGELNSCESPRSSFDEDSPYPEVRAAVSNLDDTEMPALTFRVFFIGIIMSVLRAALNTFFRLRPPAPYIAPTLVCFFAYPFGMLLSWILPIGEWKLPRWLGGFKFDLNPCSFNIKEHTLIVAMSDIGGNVCGVVIAIGTMRRNYHISHGPMFTILMCIVSQATGASFSYLLQRSAVASASLLWPELLGTTTLLNTLHADSADGKGISRKRFFGLAAIAMFFYTPIPARLFTAMGVLNWPTWIAPRNITVNQIFGVATGLGLFPITLDYTQVMMMATPFYIPWLTAMNLFFGWALFYCALAPAIYFTNKWFTGYLPLSTSRIADRFGRPYNVTHVLLPDGGLNSTAYHNYSPVYFAASYHVTHIMAFGITTSVLTHFAVHHGAHFWRCLRHKGDEERPDVHAKMMKAYPTIPGWWYGALFVGCFVAGIVGVEAYDTGMPVWGLVIILLLGLLFAIPSTFMASVTTFTPPTNVVYELVAGFMWPGRPIPLLLFKSIGMQTVTSTVNFTRGLKMGHYMKVPPRDIFIVQVIGLLACCLVNAGIYAWVPICLDCTYTTADYSASVIWGVIGPRRLWGAGSPYSSQLWALLAGALVPPILYYAHRRSLTPAFRARPRSVATRILRGLGTINVPLMFSAAYFWPMCSFMNLATFAGVVWIANYYVRRRHIE